VVLPILSNVDGLPLEKGTITFASFLDLVRRLCWTRGKAHAMQEPDSMSIVAVLFDISLMLDVVVMIDWNTKMM
jgi:hypothetical protein